MTNKKALKVENGKIQIQTPEFRTERQKQFFNGLLKEGELVGALNYIQSFNGSRSAVFGRRQFLNSPGRDAMAEKRAGHYTNLTQSLVDADTSWTPSRFETLYRKQHSDWYGVEIECFLPRDEFDVGKYDDENEGGSRECSSCDGSGREECSSCDHEHDCSDCNGDGYVESDDDESAPESIRKVQYWVEKQKIRGVSVVSDGSLGIDDSDFFAVEFRVLTRFGDTKNLIQLTDALKKVGAKVNSSCGLHIHLDVRNRQKRTVEKLGEKFGQALPALAKMVPQSRRHNRFCRLAVSDVDGDRYYAVNLTSFRKHGTIEIRLHSGTTDYLKIVNFASILKAIMDGPDFEQKSFSSVKNLMKTLRLPDDVKAYALQRELLFADPDEISADSTAHDHDDLDAVVGF